jgi:conserved domain protein
MMKQLRPWILVIAFLFSLFSTSQLEAMHVKGNELPATDLVVAGIPAGSTTDAIYKSLGDPTALKPNRVIYGGITFHVSNKHFPETTMTTIDNRDAVTARGIAVGDSIADIYTKYGQPSMVYNKEGVQILFYGVYMPTYDYRKGIEFVTNGNSIIRIKILSGISQ